jgi:quinol-cytochrome oxidoreductase complex cytochrome b subunit
MHMLLIPGGLIALITLHLYLVIRLGVTSPPWSKEAAGDEREEAITAKRGLVEPRPRGDGGVAADVRGRPEA